MELDTIMAVLAVLGYVVTFATFWRNQKKEHDETVRKLQRIEDTQAEQNRRLDSHNHYAELFSKCTEDIAYIKGKLE